MDVVSGFCMALTAGWAVGLVLAVVIMAIRKED